MKTWQQFSEDADSYARDKEAYEKQTAASDRLKARRKLAKKRMEAMLQKNKNREEN